LASLVSRGVIKHGNQHRLKIVIRGAFDKIVTGDTMRDRGCRAPKK
jgi:hypothetical protein